MKLVLTTIDGNIYPLEVSEDLDLLALKALCEQETRIPANQLSLRHDGRLLVGDNRTLASLSIRDNDIVMVEKAQSNLPLIDFSSIRVPPTQPRPSSSNSQPVRAANAFRDMLMSNSDQLAALQQRFPELGNAVRDGDTAKMMQLLEQLTGGQNMLRQSVDYFDKDEQEKIAEYIRLQNVQQNMESALEHMPEAFGHIVMLYINCRVNGHHVKAFVDSGAQMTIMSAACAERCGIMRLVDKRWAGIAKGVGTQKIVGRVHLAQIQIENSFLTTAFSILEEQPMDMLLGLDILRRHQCIIDLQRNVLVINSASVETRFLSEAELPAFARLNSYESMEDEQFNELLKSTNPSTSQEGASNETSSSSQKNKNYPEDVIQGLLALGFKRNDIIEALNDANGDVNMAKVKLLAKSFQAPPKK